MSNAALADRILDLDTEIETAKRALKALEKARGELAKGVTADTPPGAYAGLRVGEKSSTTTDWKALAASLGATDAQQARFQKTSTKAEVTSYSLEEMDPDGEFVVIDTETTGLGAGACVVQFGAAVVSGGKVAGAKGWTVNPDIRIDPAATAVHGITDAMVATAPYIEGVVHEIRAFLGTRKRVVFNRSFDQRVIENSIGEAFPIQIDALTLARRVFPGESATLDAVLARFGKTRQDGKHSAQEDAFLLAQVLPDLIRKFLADGRT